MTWHSRLATRGSPVRVAIVGTGRVGRGLAHQVRATPGLRLVILADMLRDRAEDCAQGLDLPYRLVDTPEAQALAIRCGQVAVSEDGEMAAGSGLADVLIECTDSAYSGARHAQTAMAQGAHVVMVNLAAELAFGPWLLDLGRQSDRVYTCAGAHRASAAVRLALGLSPDEPVAAGFSVCPPDRNASPRDLMSAAAVAEADGTAAAAELAVLANALGAVAHGPDWPRGAVGDARDVQAAMARLPADSAPQVGLTRGNGQAFAMSTTDISAAPATMPCHAGPQDVLDVLADAILEGRAQLAPWGGACATVVAVAKRSLQPGERLDGPGGYATYGRIETVADNVPYTPTEGLPLMLSDGLTLRRPLAQGDRIRLSDCIYAERDPRFALWRQAQKLTAGSNTGPVAAE